jgi:DNA-binding Lrp family transcriptional regulator
MTDIDKIDRKILSILQWDGRMANVELTGCIRPSPAAIGERLLALPGVKETRTYAVMDQVKRDARCRLNSPCAPGVARMSKPPAFSTTRLAACGFRVGSNKRLS